MKSALNFGGQYSHGVLSCVLYGTNEGPKIFVGGKLSEAPRCTAVEGNGIQPLPNFFQDSESRIMAEIRILERLAMTPRRIRGRRR